VCAINAGDKAAICVDKVIFAFYKFHNTSSRVAADKGDEVIDVPDALYAHLA
jgi:hypothetical protein